VNNAETGTHRAGFGAGIASYTRPSFPLAHDADVMSPPAAQDAISDTPFAADQSSPGDHAHTALTHRVRQLYANALFGLAMSFVVAVIVATSLWFSTGRVQTIVWVAAMCTILGARLVLHGNFVRNTGSATYETWLARFRMGTAMTGACWGATWLALPHDPDDRHRDVRRRRARRRDRRGRALSRDRIRRVPRFRDPHPRADLRRDADARRPDPLALRPRVDRLPRTLLGGARRFQKVLDESLRLRSSQTDLVHSLTSTNSELRQMRDTLERRVADRTQALRGQLAERERAEAELRANAEMFRLITDNVTDMIAVWDRNGRQLYGSRSLTRALVRGNISMSKPSLGEVHPDDLDRLRTVLRQTFDSRTGCHTELRLESEDGIRLIDCAVEPVPAPGDDTDKVVVVARDVTRERREAAMVREAKERLSLAIEATGQILFDVDCATQSVYLDANWSVFLGEPRREITVTFDDLIPLVPAEEHATLRDRYLRTLKGDVADYEVEHRIRLASGEYRWIASRAKVMERDDNGRALRLIGTNIDITEQRRADQRLRLMGRALDDMAEGVLIVDTDWHILWVNPAFGRITGYSPDETLGKVSRLYRLGETAGLVEGVRERGHWEGRISDRRKSGATYPAWVSASVMREPDGHPDCVVLVFTDISRQERDAERMHFLAYHDNLTGLPNRALYFQRAGDMIRRAGRQRRRVALLFVDLDHFKSVNDSLGHQIGDRVLVEAAKRLRDGLREFDVVARLGGDEFAIVLDDVEDDAAAATVAAKLIEAVGRPIVVDGHELTVFASIGISRFPGDGVTADLLLRQADAAMYLAKQEGRNRCRFFSPEITAGVMQRLDIATGLRLAVARDQLVLHYQPAVDATDGRVLSVEALLRWRHPTRGLLGPVEFIHIAEETGVIDSIGRWVLGTACRQIRKWHDAGLTHVAVKVNLSPLEFRQPGLMDQVRAAVEENNGSRPARSASRSPRARPCRSPSARSRCSPRCARSASTCRSMISARATVRWRSCRGSRSRASRSTGRSWLRCPTTARTRSSRAPSPRSAATSDSIS
jgi:diguanylate cyclase (GGDEF)-like protein/PAS domain S-box-containing protein